jgi:hypothetical protein
MVKDKTGVRMVDAATAIVERGPNCLLQETCTRPTLLKPGKYFIGDLGIAMNENDINEATKCRFASYKAGVYSHRFGKYILPNGRELLIGLRGQSKPTTQPLPNGESSTGQT